MCCSTFIKEMKTSEVDHAVGSSFLPCAEENRRAKDAFEAFDHAPIVATVFREMKELEDFCGGLKSHHAALLPDSQGGDPNGNEPVLAVGQSKIRMRDNVKEVLAVTPTMDLLGGGWPAKRQTAEDKRTSVESKFLLAVLSLLADKADRVELLDVPFADSKVGQYGGHGSETGFGTAKSVSLAAGLYRGVPEVFQNWVILRSKGFYSERKQRPRIDVKP